MRVDLGGYSLTPIGAEGELGNAGLGNIQVVVMACWGAWWYDYGRWLTCWSGSEDTFVDT